MLSHHRVSVRELVRGGYVFGMCPRYAQGVSGAVILAALKREHGYTGSYSAVRRLLASLKRETPPDATIRLDFAPGEAAQVDFGAGPMLADAAGGCAAPGPSS